MSEPPPVDPQERAASETAKHPVPKMLITVPDSVRMVETDPHKLRLKALTLEQELDASRVSDGNGDVRIWEQIKRAVFELDGKPFTIATSGFDQAINHWSPRVRRQVEVSWLRFTTPDTQGEGLDAFFAKNVTIEV